MISRFWQEKRNALGIFRRAVDEDDVLICAVTGPGPVEVVEVHDALAVAKGRVPIDDPATVKVVANDQDVVSLNNKNQLN